jgi:hypothetical protein
MSAPKELARLQSLAQMILDAQLAELRQVARARSETMAHLSDLKSPTVQMDDQMGVAEVKATLAYQLWADQRRAELNITLARQTALWLDRRDAARYAFGKADVLNTLAKRAKK